MVSRRSRSAFAVLLTFALLPIVSMAAGAWETRAPATTAWMQWQAKGQSLAQGVRASFGESSSHHDDATPFVPADTSRLAPIASPAAAAPSAPRIATAAAPKTLHSARAPPGLS